MLQALLGRASPLAKSLAGEHAPLLERYVIQLSADGRLRVQDVSFVCK
jgi:hypothetical protein